MLRRQFAEKANAVGPWIERQLDAVTAIGMGLHGTLEDQLHRLKEYEQGVYAYKPHIEELEKIHQAVQESMIFENRYETNYFNNAIMIIYFAIVQSLFYYNSISCLRNSKLVSVVIHVDCDCLTTK